MKSLHWLALFLLLFNGLGALFGGWSLMMDPTGSDLGMAVTYLEHSPFRDFFIPGIVLFTCIGLLSLLAFLWTGFKWKNYTWWIMAEGILLIGWIIIQIIFIRQFSFLQVIYGGIGMILFLTGFFLRKNLNL